MGKFLSTVLLILIAAICFVIEGVLQLAGGDPKYQIAEYLAVMMGFVFLIWIVAVSRRN